MQSTHNQNSKPLSRMNDLKGNVMDEGHTDGWTERNQDDIGNRNITDHIKLHCKIIIANVYKLLDY